MVETSYDATIVGAVLQAQADVGRVRGSAFREFVRWYGIAVNVDRLRAAVASLPEEHQALLRPDDPALGVIASTWYPAPLVHRLIDELIAGFDPMTREQLARNAAAAVMDVTLEGVYRLLFRWMATPARYAKYASRLWASYYDSGEFMIVASVPGQATAVLRDWPSHHDFVCELNLRAATEIYKAMGCREVETVREACIGHGDSECRFVTRWTMADVG